MHGLMRLLVALVALVPLVVAQDSAKGLLDLASKKAQTAKGKSGEELTAILREAAAMFEQVVVRFPAAKSEVARAQLDLGRVRKRLNDPAGAESALQAAAAAVDEPKVATEALLDLATLYRKGKKLTEAQQALDRIVAEFAGEPRQRAEALSRLASLHRAAKRTDAAEASLRQILADHGDLFGPAIEALDDLVALKVAQGREADARGILASHGEAMKTKFSGTRYESRVKPGLDRIAARFKLADDEEGED